MYSLVKIFAPTKYNNKFTLCLSRVICHQKAVRGVKPVLLWFQCDHFNFACETKANRCSQAVTILIEFVNIPSSQAKQKLKQACACFCFKKSEQSYLSKEQEQTDLLRGILVKVGVAEGIRNGKEVFVGVTT